MQKILYIEDDKEFAELIRDYLEQSGFSVELVYDGVKAMNLIKTNNYDLILCDLNLGKLTGNQIVEIVKKNNPLTNIILFTCSTDQTNELKSLRIGADDYVTKDTSFEILVERMKRLIEKEEVVKTTNSLESLNDNINVDVRNRVVTKDDKIIELTKIELDLLIYFLNNKNKLLPRESIYEEVWHVPLNSYDVDLRNIDAHIKNLRKKTGISSIATIRGIGYRWHE